MIKHLTPRPDDEVEKFFSGATIRELFNISVLGDKFIENLLNARLHTKKILSVNAEYLWNKNKDGLAITAYVQVEYTMAFIIERSEIPFLMSVMKEEFGDSVRMDDYDYVNDKLTIRFRS